MVKKVIIQDRLKNKIKNIWKREEIFPYNLTKLRAINQTKKIKVIIIQITPTIKASIIFNKDRHKDHNKNNFKTLSLIIRIQKSKWKSKRIEMEVLII